ncbi:hypothetical protein V5O48_011180 [Marasmius crinis-equi]|uniref:Uncharacterized protein n=1 Tax=Marasmius crinis-equi TaxID=585013 RepID=A0ABR3F6B4_9AGAR
MDQEIDRRDLQLDAMEDGLKQTRNNWKDLQACICELKTNQQSCSSTPSMSSGTKRKNLDADLAPTGPAPPAKRPPPTDESIPHIGYSVINTNLESGALLRPHLPPPSVPYPFEGTASGVQVPPLSSAELQQLHLKAQTPGSFHAITRLEVMKSHVLSCRYCHSKSPAIIPDISGVALETLTLAIDAPWNSHTSFVHYRQFKQQEDSVPRWQEDGNIINISAIESDPNKDTSIAAWAEGIIVHFIAGKYLGVHVTDQSQIWLPSMCEYMLYSILSLSLMDESEKDVVPGYCTNRLTLMANIGLYRGIIARDHLSVASECKLTKCVHANIMGISALVAHLALCGITAVEMDSHVYFSLQYCLDACQLAKYPPCTF